MKKIKFLAMALAALAIVSCSKESDTINNPLPGSKAKVTVKIVGQEDYVEGKAGGPSDNGTTEVKVKDYIIFLFNADGGLVGSATEVSGADEGTVSDATTAAKNIYIVANTGTIADGGYFANVESVADLKKCAGDLIKINKSTQTKDNLWMVGTGTVGQFQAGADKDAPSTATGTVELKFLSAKIDVAIQDQRVHTEAALGVISIVDNQVALLFAGAKGKFFETEANQAKQTTFYSGITGYPGQSQAGNTTQTAVLADDVKAKFAANPTKAVEYHFYTFGNDATTMPTILTIKSTRTDAEGATKDIYYPVQFSTTDAGQKIVPGQQYKVTLTLTGDINNGGGGGTTDPEEELRPAEITVTVEPAEWKTVIEVDKVFN